MRAHADAACLHLSSTSVPGCSRPHARQLLAIDFVPAAIARERERFGGYATRTMGGNLLGDLLQEEVRHRERIVAIDAEAVLLAAYAARAPYQLMMVPRTPRMRFEDDGPTGAALLHDARRRLAPRLGSIPPLNLWVRTAPQGAEHFCWRIDMMPRLDASGRARARRRRDLNSWRPTGRRRAARRRDASAGPARASRVGRASVASGSHRSVRGCSCCWASRTRMAPRTPRGSPPRSARCGSSRTPTAG